MIIKEKTISVEIDGPLQPLVTKKGTTLMATKISTILHWLYQQVIKNEIIDNCGDNKDFRGYVKVSHEGRAFFGKKGERVNRGAVAV